MEDLLRIENLSVDYETDYFTVHALTGLDLRIRKGEVLGFVGETGAGKTTTAKAIMGLLQTPPARRISGSILFEGENLFNKSKKEMRRIRGSEISIIFQDPMTSINPVMRVIDQVAEVFMLHKTKNKAKAYKMSREILNRVGIKEDRVMDYPQQFSGGMKQRVVIAMALAASPKLLLADEPTSALDVTIQAQVLKLIAELQEEFNSAMLLITHDLGIVAEVCDRVSVIYAGSIVETGTKKQIFENPSHPYTQGLFNCIPDLSREAKVLIPIKGLMPDPSNLPRGCAFYDRCPRAHDACRSVSLRNFGRAVPLYKMEEEHHVACVLFSEKEEAQNG